MVTATDGIALVSPQSGLFTQATSGGQGGDIDLRSREIRLMDGAVISAESTGAGNAGSIRLAASDGVYMVGSTITTAAQQADGGNLQVQDTDFSVVCFQPVFTPPSARYPMKVLVFPELLNPQSASNV